MILLVLKQEFKGPPHQAQPQTVSLFFSILQCVLLIHTGASLIYKKYEQSFSQDNAIHFDVNSCSFVYLILLIFFYGVGRLYIYGEIII